MFGSRPICSILTSSRSHTLPFYLNMATVTIMAESQSMVLEGAIAPSKIEQLPFELKLDITSYVSVRRQSLGTIN